MPSFTQDAIKKSFIKLLNEKPFNKITVKDIVVDCGINRNSFYYHFDDIPSLLEQILLDETGEIVQSPSAQNSIYECLIKAIDFALKNKTAVIHIYNSANREMFEQYLNRVSERAVSDYINSLSADYDINDDDKEVLILYYKCQLVGFVIDWLGGGMKYDLCIKLRRLCELYEGSMETAFKRADNSKSKIE